MLYLKIAYDLFLIWQLRVKEYLLSKTDHILVDPDVNFIFTRRKKRALLGQVSTAVSTSTESPSACPTEDSVS